MFTNTKKKSTTFLDTAIHLRLSKHENNHIIYITHATITTKKKRTLILISTHRSDFFFYLFDSFLLLQLFFFCHKQVQCGMKKESSSSSGNTLSHVEQRTSNAIVVYCCVRRLEARRDACVPIFEGGDGRTPLPSSASLSPGKPPLYYVYVAGCIKNVQ